MALCGVSEHALLQLLSEQPQVQKIGLCLDNDKAGIKARERIISILAERGYRNVFSLFSHQKDWNEDLQTLRQPQAEQPAVNNLRPKLQMT